MPLPGAREHKKSRVLAPDPHLYANPGFPARREPRSVLPSQGQGYAGCGAVALLQVHFPVSQGGDFLVVQEELGEQVDILVADDVRNLADSVG